MTGALKGRIGKLEQVSPKPCTLPLTPCPLGLTCDVSSRTLRLPDLLQPAVGGCAGVFSVEHRYTKLTTAATVRKMMECAFFL